MKLSQAIETEYRGNLTFHTGVRWTPADSRTHVDVERSFDATFFEPECFGHEPDPERVQGYPQTEYCDGSCGLHRAHWGHA